MKEIIQQIQFISDYANALSDGVNKFLTVLPIMIRQEFETKSRQKLRTTQSSFMDALNISLEDHVLVVNLDPDDFIANAVENGVSPYSLREGLLKGKSARFSKKGHRYAVIPIRVNKDVTPGTDKGQQIQAKILEVLNKKRFGSSTTSVMMDGQVRETQKVLTDDPDVSGLVRTRLHKSAKHFFEKKIKPKWGHVMFRMISDNPESKSFAGWKHPGIQPAGIFSDVNSWLNANAGVLLDEIIRNELKDVLAKKAKMDRSNT